MIVDKLVFKDVQLTATNDDQYFVFEDVLYQIMLCFTRDTEINSVLNPFDPINAPAPKAIQYDGPPSGVVPFHGICMFGKSYSFDLKTQHFTVLLLVSAAPFCYLYDSPAQLYFAFRAFYIRYCHRLTTINTHPQVREVLTIFRKYLRLDSYTFRGWSACACCLRNYCKRMSRNCGPICGSSKFNRKFNKIFFINQFPLLYIINTYV